MTRLRTRDYECMLDLVVSVLEVPAGEAPWHLVLAELVRALHGGVGVLSEVNWDRRQGHVHLWTPASLGELGLNAVIDAHLRREHPLARHYAVTHDQSPLAVTDVVPELAWRNSEAFSVTREVFGSTRHFTIPFPERNGRSTLGFVVHRDGTRFTESERGYAQRMQPLLSGIERHFRTLRRWSSVTGPGAPAIARELRLTNREIAVLRLLYEAFTAERIARSLGISPRTVHKHLESLYRKLGTSDRLSAVLRAQSLGLLPGASGTVRH